jgi:phage shock protein A
MKTGKKGVSPARVDADSGATDPLLASLDTLEEKIKLLLARHESLAAANAVSEERRRARGSLDPIELQDRVRALETDKERIERHAAFLEDRIRGLLSRVRYVIES